MTLRAAACATRRSSRFLLAVALFVLARQSDRFFTTDNLLNQGRLMAEVGLVALPMTFVIVTGGIDLSVGSILGMAAILLGVFWKNLGLPLPRRHGRRGAGRRRSRASSTASSSPASACRR